MRRGELQKSMLQRRVNMGTTGVGGLAGENEEWEMFGCAKMFLIYVTNQMEV